MHSLKSIKLGFYVPLLVITTLMSCSSGNEDKQYTIRKGTFSASIVETGELQALKNNMIVTPPIRWGSGDLKLSALVEHGTKVKEGDIIAEIDKSSIMRTILDLESRLEMQQTALNKMLIQQSTRQEEIKTEIASQEASYTMAKLQLEKSKFESEKRQQIKKLEFERTTIMLEKARERMKANEIISKKNIFIQRVRVRQIENNIKAAKKDLEYFAIKSPVNGMIEIRRDRRSNAPLKIGDRIWPGSPIASIPDISTMIVYARINENDISKLKLGQKTLVRLQALPNQSFSGKVVRINPICYSPDQDSRVKVFDFEILLDSINNVLKPGMSVSCEVFFADYKNVFFVENECIIRSDTANYIMLSKGQTLCPVTLGATNNKFTIISGNINKGDKVIPVKELQKSQKP